MENKNDQKTNEFAEKFLSAYKSPADKAKLQKKKSVYSEKSSTPMKTSNEYTLITPKDSIKRNKHQIDQLYHESLLKQPLIQEMEKKQLNHDLIKKNSKNLLANISKFTNNDKMNISICNLDFFSNENIHLKNKNFIFSDSENEDNNSTSENYSSKKKKIIWGYNEGFNNKENYDLITSFSKGKTQEHKNLIAEAHHMKNKNLIIRDSEKYFPHDIITNSKILEMPKQLYSNNNIINNKNIIQNSTEKILSSDKPDASNTNKNITIINVSNSSTLCNKALDCKAIKGLSDDFFKDKLKENIDEDIILSSQLLTNKPRNKDNSLENINMSFSFCCNTLNKTDSDNKEKLNFSNNKFFTLDKINKTYEKEFQNTQKTCSQKKTESISDEKKKNSYSQKIPSEESFRKITDYKKDNSQYITRNTNEFSEIKSLEIISQKTDSQLGNGSNVSYFKDKVFRINNRSFNYYMDYLKKKVNDYVNKNQTCNSDTNSNYIPKDNIKKQRVNNSSENPDELNTNKYSYFNINNRESFTATTSPIKSIRADFLEFKKDKEYVNQKIKNSQESLKNRCEEMSLPEKFQDIRNSKKKSV